MKTAIFITVRSGSSRLPGKCYLEICGKTTIEYVIERAKLVKAADLVILCTTTKREDDRLCQIAQKHGIKIYRGSTEDKLKRWLRASKTYGVDFFITADGDDLFCSVELMRRAIVQAKRNNSEFIYAPKSFTCGAFTYGISSEVLEKVCERKGTNDTEMIEPYFKDSGLCKAEELEIQSGDYLFCSQVRATLDYPEDYEFFKSVIEECNRCNFDINDWFKLFFVLQQKKYSDINKHCHEKWKENQQEKTKLVLKKDSPEQEIMCSSDIESREQPSKSKFKGRELEYVKKVLDSNLCSSTEGGWCNKLEKAFSEKFGANYGVAMNSCTAALHSALIALGVRPGDEVITPALTVFMDTSSILHCSAIPVYADIKKDTFNIDPEDVVKKITPKTKAIIGVSLYGVECDVERLEEIARQYDLGLIIDNAQHLGPCRGDITVYSFENSKHLAAGEGGMAITNNAQLAASMRKLSNHGFKNSLASEGRTKLSSEALGNTEYERHTSVGWNYRMPEINAAIVYEHLVYLDEIIERRRAIGELYLDMLEKIDTNGVYLRFQAGCCAPSSTLWTFPVINILGFEPHVKEMNKFYGAWKLPFEEPVMKTRAFAKMNPHVYEQVKYENVNVPEAQKIQKYLYQFPTNQLTLEEAREDIEKIKKVLEKILYV